MSSVTVDAQPREVEIDVVELDEVKRPSAGPVPALHFPDREADHDDHHEHEHEQPSSPLPARLIIEKVASDDGCADLAERLEKLKVSDHVIQQLKADRKREKVASFYTAQNEVLEGLKSMAMAKSDGADEADQDPVAVHRLLKFSLSLTFVLICLKMTSAIWSASVAVIASSMDSVLDVLSQGSLLLTSRLMRKYDPYKYPTGKARLEPLGVMVFAVIMGMSAIILLYQSVLVLKDGFESTPESIRMDAITLSLLGVGICIQVCMYFYCSKIARENNNNPSALAIAADNMNDVAINFVGVIPAVIAGYTSSAWFLDPLSAICIALYICFRWTVTCIQQLKTLVGRSASAQFIGQLAYLAAIHDSRILRVDTVLAYSVGQRLQVEVHIVLPADMPLCEAHDIGEGLEQKIESLESVEIAFVHLDYEFSHKPEHGRLKHHAVKKE